MGATTWTKQTATATNYQEGIVLSHSVTGFALFGIPIPISNGAAYADPSVVWTEGAITATAQTEMTVAATNWSELSG